MLLKCCAYSVLLLVYSCWPAEERRWWYWVIRLSNCSMHHSPTLNQDWRCTHACLLEHVLQHYCWRWLYFGLAQTIKQSFIPVLLFLSVGLPFFRLGSVHATLDMIMIIDIIINIMGGIQDWWFGFRGVLEPSPLANGECRLARVRQGYAISVSRLFSAVVRYLNKR